MNSILSSRYDSLYRITEATETQNGSQTWTQQFGYDRFGNRVSTAQNILGIANNTTPAVDPLTNRFVTAGTTFEYDLNGNLVRDQEGRQFTFNGDNKQTQVKDASNNVVGTYYYDGEGHRVKKVTQTETVVYVYSNSRQIAEYSTAAPPQNPTTNYTATDMLGSPRVLTDSLGNVVSRRDFLPFGEELYADGVHRTVAGKYSQTGQDGVRQRFTGYEKDAETSLDFAQARMYANTYGRFTAVDPLLASGKSANPQTFNRYVYVLNNPLLLTDPNGLQSGKWYMPVTADGESDQSRKYKYILNGESTDGYKEVTMRNRNGDLIGYFPGTTLIEGPGGKVWADFVARFNPMGPQKPMPTVDMNTGRPGVEGLTEYDRKGWEIIFGDDYSKVWPSTGAVQDVSVETFTTVIPVARGLSAIARTTGSALLTKAVQAEARSAATNALAETPASILRPGGELIGVPGKGLTRDVAGGLDAANSLAGRLISAGVRQVFKPGYPGHFFEFNSGGTFGIRQVMTRSPNAVCTIDCNIPHLFVGKLKF